MNKVFLGLCCASLLVLGGCSRQQSDWEKTRAANTADAYEQFLKRYPNGEFSKQAQARVKELYEERDWQKARDTDTQEAYQAFLKQHPEGKWAEEARIRIENFTLAQTPSSASPAADAAAAGGAAPASPASPPRAPAASAKAKAPPARAEEPRAEAKRGAYAVQLGAFKSKNEAGTVRWQHLQKRYPTLLATLSPTVRARKSAHGTLYRLQITHLSAGEAHQLCKELKTHAQPCVIIPPAHPARKHA